MKTAKVRSPYAVSAKSLGEFNTPDFCPRCWSLRNKLRSEVPFSMPPAGILSRLDSMQKKLIKNSALPSFLNAYNGQECIELHRQTYVDSETGIELTGVPDLAFRDADGNITILDLKSSKPPAEATEWSERMLAIYAAQLHAYKILLEARGEGKVTSLSIMYLWPETMISASGGVSVEFKATELPVALDGTLIPRLFVKAKALLDSELSTPTAGCADCARVANFLVLLNAAPKAEGVGA